MSEKEVDVKIKKFYYAVTRCVLSAALTGYRGFSEITRICADFMVDS